jgi:cytochrome c oxidase subunit II
MTSSRRTGPTPALVVGVATVATVVIFLVILAARGNVVEQLGAVWRSFFPPAAETSQGVEVRGLYDIVFLFAAAIFVVVEGLIVFAVIRYRRKPTDTELPPQIHGNNLLEIVWTLVPTLIVLFLFVVSWQTLNQVDQADASSPIHIRAVASRFQWQFEYLSADGKTVQFKQQVPEMEVPVGEKVHLTLTSPDVIHAFYVPQFLFKRDVVPGRENSFDFTVDQAGTYRGQCAELCGEFHYAMQFTVKGVSPADYQSWLQAQIAQANAPSASPAASGGSTGQTLQLTAQNVAFQETNLSAAPDVPFTIAFSNQDAGTSHNVDIQDSTGKSVFRGQVFAGPGTQNYAVPALAAGTYKFVCDVHPSMTGTLTVK